MNSLLKTKAFARFARREKISVLSLREAIERADRGLVDADLGGGLIKQRVARAGQGRSGGYRVLVAFRARDRAVFLFGFAKNERSSIEPDEMATLRSIAAAWLAADTAKMQRALRDGTLIDVEDDD